jgi:transposase
MIMNELPNLSTLTSEQKDDLIHFLFDQVIRLTARVAELTARVAELEARLSKDSHNSSKPPSSDGMTKRTKSLRTPSGRKPGGQPGHLGQTLKRVECPDQVITHSLPETCNACGEPLAEGVRLDGESRQVFDLPVLRLEVVEHRTLAMRCACGRTHRSRFPEGVANAVQYGPRIQSVAGYLTQFQLLPVDRTRQMLRDVFAVRLSSGTIQTVIKRTGARLSPCVADIAQAVSHAPVAHFDESGLRVGRTLEWLHTAATASLSWYGRHGKRGHAAMDDHGILPSFQGVAVHDGWAPYRKYSCTHALCNAHHLRELTFLAETIGQSWPNALIKLLIAAKEEVAAGGGHPLAPTRIESYQQRYHAILAEGNALNPVAEPAVKHRGRAKQSDAVNLLRRLQEHSDDVLRFLTDVRVPFDNNLAERAIRMPKLKQKVSGTFRSAKGADAFCIIRSYLATMRKQGQDIFHSLIHSFQGQIISPILSG